MLLLSKPKIAAGDIESAKKSPVLKPSTIDTMVDDGVIFPVGESERSASHMFCNNRDGRYYRTYLDMVEAKKRLTILSCKAAAYWTLLLNLRRQLRKGRISSSVPRISNHPPNPFVVQHARAFLPSLLRHLLSVVHRVASLSCLHLGTTKHRMFGLSDTRS